MPNTKQILNEIDKLIADAESGKRIHEEVIREIEAISNTLAKNKDDRQAKPLLDLVGNMDKFISSSEENNKTLITEIVNAIGKIKIETPVNVEIPDVVVPKIELPEVSIEIPEIKIPDIKVKVPEIKIPDIKIPEQKAPIVKMPSSMKIDKPTWFSGLINPISKQLIGIKNILSKLDIPFKPGKPLSVRLSDGDKFYKSLGGGSFGGGGQTIFANSEGDKKFPLVSEDDILQSELVSNGVNVGINNSLPVQTTSQDNFSIDAFGRTRVSQTDQRFDSEFIYDKQPLLFDEELVGTGAIVHNSATRDLTLTNNSIVDGDSARVIQKWHNPYTPGNSQLVDITGTLNEANILGGTASIFLVNNGVETEIDQVDWDNPVADVDWNFSQIFQMDFQSLKVGRIRFNLVRNGVPVQVHEIVNDNIRSGGYWQYPAQPIVWEIYNTATETIMEIAYHGEGNGIGFRYSVPINAGATMRAICSTVKSEGGGSVFDMAGFHFVADNDITNVSVGTTLVPILTIKIKSTFNSLTNDSIIIPQGFEISTNNPIKYVILLNATLTGAIYNDVDTNSVVEFDVASSAVSGGTIVDSGYISIDRNTSTGKKGLLGRTIMSIGHNGSPDTLTIAGIRTSTSNGDTKAVTKWKEIR